MTYIVKPVNHHPNLEKNDLGLTRRDYEGTISTLCAGCGHDSISAAVIEACYDLSLSSDQIAKLSGIGCSSKSPSYFLNQAHGFNSVHGRMPSVATGANLGNQRFTLFRCIGRWRYSRHRDWAIHACSQKTAQHNLYRGK